MTRIDPADPAKGSCIDYILASPELALRATHSQVVPVLGLATDHLLLFASFSLGMLTKCVHRAVLRKHMKAQSVWNFNAMGQEEWSAFSKVSEDLVTAALPHVEWGQLGVSLCHQTVDNIWEILAGVLKSAAERIIPQCQVGGEPRPPKEEVPLNCCIRLLGQLLHYILAPESFKVTDAQLRYSTEKTYASFQVSFGQTDTHAALQASGLVALPDLPDLVPVGASTWRSFVSHIQSLWVALQLMHSTQQAMVRAELIRTCVQRCCDLMKSNQGQMIRNILEQHRCVIRLDKVVKDIPGGGFQVIDEPTAVLSEIQGHFQQWTSKRQVQPLAGRWIEIYRPSQTIDPHWYDGLMFPPTQGEIQLAISQGPTGKAGGPTCITNEMIKHLGKQGLELFTVLCVRVFTDSQCPSAWKCGLIYPIPKTATWCGDLDAVRPITLLEHAWKVCLSVLTGRLSQLCSQHAILHPNNFSVLKGSSVHEPLHALNAIMEDAQERKRELWVVLQDICCAFDSVDWEMARQAFARLHLPAEYIKLYASLADQKSNQVITPFGLTDPYIAESGLDQGAVEAPIHWHICYDPLLCAMDTLLSGYTMRVSWKGPRPSGLLSGSSVPVSALAYVDDTVWLACSQAGAHRMLSVAMEFFELNDIAVNAKKTVLIVLNPTVDPEASPLMFGRPALPMLPIPASEGT